jgi:hypothetical protein
MSTTVEMPADLSAALGRSDLVHEKLSRSVEHMMDSGKTTIFEVTYGLLNAFVDLVKPAPPGVRRGFANVLRACIENLEQPTREEKLAAELRAYMTFRASREGVEYDLNEEFLIRQLIGGVGKFFGVQVGSDMLLSDEQKPDLFAEWKRMSTH